MGVFAVPVGVSIGLEGVGKAESVVFRLEGECLDAKAQQGRALESHHKVWVEYVLSCTPRRLTTSEPACVQTNCAEGPPPSSIFF